MTAWYIDRSTSHITLVVYLINIVEKDGNMDILCKPIKQLLCITNP